LTSSTNATDLSGKVAVVTGAAAGLGRAEAVGLARAGATVVVNDIAAALDASDVIDEITTAGAKVVAVAGDVTERATADELVSCADGLGGLSIVVNNAGISRDRMLFNMSDEEWDAVIAVHLRGHFLLTRNAATYWRSKAKESDGTVYGRIINTSSEAGLMGPVGQANYGAAKAGISALTLTAARALGRYGVRANAICPRARTARRRRRRDRPVVARACGDPGPLPGISGGQGRQRSGFRRVRPSRDADGGAQRRAPLRRGRAGVGCARPQRRDAGILCWTRPEAELRSDRINGVTLAACQSPWRTRQSHSAKDPAAPFAACDPRCPPARHARMSRG
jgi:NAD(P)-dependent dehydrogenase (short-subunit alcohol dehydrogenase family)